ncbi:translation initiation factor IF-2 [mine drainage metagenome]|uniref:Translation initiation factor IF-2 n=3 Tax=mine drainage metagenome TaxID=410659 RepID=T1BHQ2_9ZZZZ
MTDQTVREFAESVRTPVDRLITQFREAGIALAGPDVVVTEDQKMLLLNFLRHHEADDDAAPSRITLKRRSVSALKVAGAQGRSKTVNVEVKQRRTYVKREVLLEQESRRRELEAIELERQQALSREDDLRRQQQDKIRQEEEQRQREMEKEQRERESRERVEIEVRQKQDEDRRRVEAQLRRELEEEEKRQRNKVHTKPVGRPVGSPAGRLSLKPGASAGARPGRERVVAEKVLPQVREIVIPEMIGVGELAQRLGMKASELIKALLNMGVMAAINQQIDQETAVLVVEELGHKAKIQREDALETDFSRVLESETGNALPRPPVVTIMGHVDHGKTSLLDYIRRTRVAAGEAGGITQHIGAYHVDTPKGTITFLDTPGHAAFTAMRARGAQVTDIVILVVAADDGVKSQTIEAIQHARAAKVPIVVAVNKIDKPEADLERVKSELAQQEVLPEEWGGDTMFIPVSAKTGDGIDALLDAVLVQSEVLELKAPREGRAVGVVLESSLEAGRGTTATILNQRGTLRVGDILLAGKEYGRVRALFNERGERIVEVFPSMPAMVLGFSDPPQAGDVATVVQDERQARELAEYRSGKMRTVRLQNQRGPVLGEDAFAHLERPEVQSVAVVLKADVHGSLEAIRSALTELGTSEVSVEIVSSGVGGLTEGDIYLAAASHARILAFNVRPDAAAKRALAEQGVEVDYYSVIYQVLEDMRRRMGGLLKPEIREQIIGTAQVREVFRAVRFGQVAGSLVTEGRILRDRPARVLRNQVVIFEGTIASLRRFKEDVAEVQSGTECGIAIQGYNDIKPGDQIEVFERTEVTRSI